MKKDSIFFRTPKEPFLETDIEDSSPHSRPAHPRPRNFYRPIKKFSRELSHPQPTQIKLFRFRLKHHKKTLRVPCFEEDLLNLPHRFTRRLNAMVADNDAETDEEVAEREKQRCEGWLREAIKEQEGHE